jgi:hypothetical protein
MCLTYANNQVPNSLLSVFIISLNVDCCPAGQEVARLYGIRKQIHYRPQESLLLEQMAIYILILSSHLLVRFQIGVFSSVSQT